MGTSRSDKVLRLRLIGCVACLVQGVPEQLAEALYWLFISKIPSSAALEWISTLVSSTPLEICIKLKKNLLILEKSGAKI